MTDQITSHQTGQARTVNGVKELPLACTLSPAQGTDRLRRWQDLGDDVRGAVWNGRLSLRVTYQASALGSLEPLVRAEQHCCAFLDWSLASSGGELVLTVEAPEAAKDELDRIAVLFGADGPSAD
jgi:hypothetical protein